MVKLGVRSGSENKKSKRSFKKSLEKLKWKVSSELWIYVYDKTYVYDFITSQCAPFFFIP